MLLPSPGLVEVPRVVPMLPCRIPSSLYAACPFSSWRLVPQGCQPLHWPYRQPGHNHFPTTMANAEEGRCAERLCRACYTRGAVDATSSYIHLWLCLNISMDALRMIISVGLISLCRVQIVLASSPKLPADLLSKTAFPLPSSSAVTVSSFWQSRPTFPRSPRLGLGVERVPPSWTQPLPAGQQL